MGNLFDCPKTDPPAPSSEPPAYESATLNKPPTSTDEPEKKVAKDFFAALNRSVESEIKSAITIMTRDFTTTRYILVGKDFKVIAKLDCIKRYQVAGFQFTSIPSNAYENSFNKDCVRISVSEVPVDKVFSF